MTVIDKWPFTGNGGGMSHVVRKLTHREKVYDKRFSTRGFRHFHRMSTSGHAAQVAHDMGMAVGADPLDVPKRWRKNPYPPGRRHDLYEQGIKDGQDMRDEERTYRRWNRD